MFFFFVFLCASGSRYDCVGENIKGVPMTLVSTDSYITTYDNRWDKKRGLREKRLSSFPTALPTSRAIAFSSFSEYLLSWQLSGRHMFDMTGRV